MRPGGRFLKEFQQFVGRLTTTEASFSKNFARFINERNVIPLMEEFGRAETDISQNVNARMVFFDLALQVIVLLIK